MKITLHKDETHSFLIIDVQHKKISKRVRIHH